MCGIVGIWSEKSTNTLFSDFTKATESLAHRGPNHQGIWRHNTHSIYLGNRRLAIQDLSDKGNQPIHSPCGRYVIVLNGEIYNYLELKKLLQNQNYILNSNSDSEVLGVAFSEWGIKKTLDRCNGMFAIGVWDEVKQSLFLIRDRLGIKPLYFGHFTNTIIFASELKAFRYFSQIPLSLNDNALTLYFRYGYIPTPYSIYKNVHKLTPGTIIEVSYNQNFICKKETYWDLQEVWQSGINNPIDNNEDHLAVVLEEKILSSLKYRMISDVPVGAFLSGGIDSSLVVSLLTKISNQVKTFSIGFPDSNYNEAHHAKRIAEHLQTDHRELYVSHQDFFSVICQLPDIWDEPFADSSQIPTYIVSKLAKQDVTVVLSGDGGDELFSGYRRYQKGEIVEQIMKLPLSLRRMALLFYPFLCKRQQRRKLQMLTRKEFAEAYKLLISHELNPSKFLQKKQGKNHFQKNFSEIRGDCFQKMSFWDLGMYLPDDILTKVDRASMAVSLEARVPMLDHNIVAFSASLLTQNKRKGDIQKYILHKILGKYLPHKLFNRRKQGFGIPKLLWLNKYYRDWFCETLSEQKVKKHQVLNVNEIKTMKKNFIKGNFCDSMWHVLILQLWLDKYL